MGRTTSDLKGACTCYTNNGSSLVDYVLCSKSMIDRIDLKVEDINPLSNQCTVTTNISLSIPAVHSRNTPHIDYTCTSHTHIPYRWKQNFRKEYETHIESIAIQTQLDNIYDTLQEENSTPCIIKNSVIQLLSIIREASRTCSMYSTHTRQGRKTVMPWHDEECKTYRNTFLRAKRNTKPPRHSVHYKLHDLYTANVVKQKKAVHEEQVTETHMKLKYENPRLCWKTVKPR